MIKITNDIHLIWLGSFLKTKHQARIVEWKSLNPSLDVNLWIDRTIIDEETYCRFCDFCTENHIILQNIEQLESFDKDIWKWLQTLAANPLPNHGARSDLLRFLILKNGGWYFDTDIAPQKLPMNLSLPHGFALNISNNIMHIDAFSPSILVSSKENPFIMICIMIIRQYATLLSSELDPIIHNRDILVRMLGTHLTTGGIALAACEKLYIHHPSQSLLLPLDPSGSKIGDYMLYEKIALFHMGYADFTNHTEKSWFQKDNGELYDQLENEEGLRAYFNGLIQLPPICLDIYRKCEKLWQNISPFCLSCENSPLPISQSKLGLFRLPQPNAIETRNVSMNQNEKVAAIALSLNND